MLITLFLLAAAAPQSSPSGLRPIFIWSCGDDLHNGSAPHRASKNSVRACGPLDAIDEHVA